MLSFISNHFTALCILGATLASLVLNFINWRLNKKGKVSTEVSTVLSGASETLTKVYKMLPSLITFSETMNSGKGGAVKKEFVLNYINQLFAMMGTTLDDETIAAISGAIDDIVTATKQMHTGGAK